MAEVKCWGATAPVCIERGMHMHRIVFERGGVCSEHHHTYRWNLFYVLSGVLVVRTWAKDGRITETTLRAHDSYAVPPRVKHQFEGVKSGVALEVYWAGTSDEVLPYDIVRFTQGFMR